MSGFTDEEVFLNNLGANSFLRFWSWPNLFRDQGDSNKNGDGKEICDLSVVFGNDIILFSDKKIVFNTAKELDVAWLRWSRKAIGESVKQVKGARRWFEEYPDRIFVDQKCTQKIPVKIPAKKDIRFHNVVVCHGIEGVLASFNREKSFIFDNSIKGSSHWTRNKTTPFCVGQIFEGGFVHIFNESTIELVLREFDTTKDFTHYLSQREELLSSVKHIRVSSESDIVQLYYENFDEEKGERSIWPKEIIDKDSVIIDMGGIERLYNNTLFKAKKKEDRVSYFWDDLIESFSFHILNGSAEFVNWNHPIEVEPSVRFLASTSRFERRVLANAFKGFYEKALPGQRGTRLFLDPVNPENAYVFCLVPQHLFPTQERYREVRRIMVQDYCAINKFLDRKIKNIVGIACKTREDYYGLTRRFFNEGQDFVFLKGDDWEENDYLEAKKIHDEYVSNGLLVDRNKMEVIINEFPESIPSALSGNVRIKGKDRNKACYCGSGNKLKKCCGKKY